MEIILASGSPRRRELLEMLGLREFIIDPARGEEIFDPGARPVDAAMALSAAKAREIAEKHTKDALVIAADTMVLLDGEIMGKPISADDAEKMLSRLSGREHLVITGVTIIMGGLETSRAEETKVFFRELEPNEIRAYVRTGEPMDKAGSYAAQGMASVFVERIEGDFFNVMGLPLCRLQKMLKGLGVKII